MPRRCHATKAERALQAVREVVSGMEAGDRLTVAELLGRLPAEIAKPWVVYQATQQLAFTGVLRRVNPTPAVWMVEEVTT